VIPELESYSPRTFGHGRGRSNAGELVGERNREVVMLWDRRVALRADRAIEQSLHLEGLLENVGSAKPAQLISGRQLLD